MTGEIFNTNICTLRRFEQVVRCWDIYVYRRKFGPCHQYISAGASHRIRTGESILSSSFPPPVGSTSVAMRWEIENEGCRKLPSCSSRGSSTWREFYEPQVSNTFNTLKHLEPTVLNAISLEMFILPVVWLPVLWPCPCTADWRHSGFKQSGLDWSLLVFRISRQNKTCLSGVWNMTGCFWWIVSVHLEWRGWVLAKQKYFKYLI